jgi:gliding motility-associated-like protein
VKTRFAFFIFILSVFLNRSFAQSNPCGLEVEAGPDITICPGIGKQLHSTIICNYGFNWQYIPPDGISGSGLDPLATPVQTTTYTLTASAKANNAVINGSFETGLLAPSTSDYTPYNDINLWSMSTGGYMILTQTQMWPIFLCTNTIYPGYGTYIMDVTPTAPGINIWCQTITVIPDQDYQVGFAMFGKVSYPGPSPEAGLFINGNLIISNKAPVCGNGGGGSKIWNSGIETSAEICIQNIGVTGPENKYGIDNISLRAICYDSDTVTVTVTDELKAVVLPPDEVSCLNRPITLDASGSTQGPGIRYKWSTGDGYIETGHDKAIAIVNAPGTYVFKITSPDCEIVLPVIVKGSTTPPDIKISAIDIDCKNPQGTIEASSKSKFPTFEWSGPGGFFSLDSTNKNIKELGWYTVKVTDAYGCESTASVEVKDKRPLIDADITGDLLLSCLIDSVILEVTSVAKNPVYNWTGPLMFKKNDTNKIVVKKSGWYQVTTISQEGCKEFDSVYVTDLSDAIPVSIRSDTLTCNTTEVILELQTDTTAKIKWKGPNGFQSNEFQPKVSESGWYYVEIETRDSCKRIDSIFVAKALDIPDIFISSNDTITCDKKFINVTGGSNSPGTLLEWITPSGTIKNQNNIQVVDSGSYTLIVSDANGCSISKSLQIFKDLKAPIISGYNDTLTCTKKEVYLIANFDNARSYEWTGPNGFKSDKDTVQTNQGGAYILIGTGMNGCSDTAQVFIVSDTLHPALQSSDDTLNCIKTLVQLNLNDLHPSNYFWTGPNNFTSTNKNPGINTPGVYEVTATLPNGCSSTEQINISTDFAKPVIQVSDDSLTCKTDSISLSANKDLSNAIVEWTGPNGFSSDQINPFVTNPGNYTLIVTNPNGCKDTATLIIYQDIGKPDLAANNDTLNCVDRQADLFANSSRDSLTYLWTGPNGFTSSAKDVSVNKGGIYTIRISTPEECFSLLNVEVYEDTLKPDLLLTPDTLNCLKTQTNLQYNSNAQLINYDWSGPANFNSSQQNPLIIQGGIYTLKVTSANQCTEQKTISILQDTIKPQLSAIGDSINCIKREIDLVANIIPSNLIGEWTTPNQQKIKTNAIKTKAGGDFVFDVVGDNHCVNSILLNIPVDTLAPDLIVKDDTINCRKGFGQLSASSTTQNLKYKWTGPASYTSSLSHANVSTGGVYHLLITALNGCTRSADVVISYDTIRPILFITGDTIIDCTHREIILTSSSNIPNSVIRWTRLDTFKDYGNIINLTVKKSGLYNAWLKNLDNHCSVAKDIKIIADSLIITDIVITPINPVCGDKFGSAQIVKIVGGHSDIQYSIDQKKTFTSNPNFDPLPAGNYTLYVKDEKNCEFQKDFQIVELPYIETDIVPEIKLILGDSSRMDLDIFPDRKLIKSITWTPSTYLSCTDCEDPMVTPLTTTDYQVTVIDTNGCQSIQRIRVVVELPEVWVPNVFTPNGDNINDHVWIHGSKAEVTKIKIFQIFDRWGNEVFEKTNFQPNESSDGWDGTYKNQKCSPGVYVYWAEVELTDGHTWIIKGDITLIR